MSRRHSPAARSALGRSLVCAAAGATALWVLGLGSAALGGANEGDRAAVEPRCDVDEVALCEAFAAAMVADLGLPAASELRVSALSLPSDPALAAGFEVVEIDVPARPRARAPVVAQATLRLANGDHRTHWLRAEVDLRVPTVVARGEIARGAPIVKRDVAVEMAPYDAGDLRDPGQAVGRVTKRALRAGDALRATLLEIPNAVTRGQRVTAVIQGERFALRTDAEVLRAGAVGQVVPVTIAASGKRLDARVLGPDSVEVVR